MLSIAISFLVSIVHIVGDAFSRRRGDSPPERAAERKRNTVGPTRSSVKATIGMPVR